MNDGAKSADDKKRAAYNAGIGVGMQMNMIIKKQIILTMLVRIME